MAAMTVTPNFTMGNGTFLDTNPDKPRPDLVGKRAMLKLFPDTGLVHAQFDDECIPEGYGWHEFQTRQFMMRPKVKWDEPA